MNFHKSPLKNPPNQNPSFPSRPTLMEGSAEPVFINNNHNSPDSDNKTPCRRRKLVQSTLFPHKSQENNNCDDVDKEEEESGKRKRGRPKRTTPPTIKAHPINGQEAGRKERSDFFRKVSEKKLQQKQQNVEGAEPCLQINVMEESTEAEKTGIMEAKNGNLPDSEIQTPRRRFDQSTLYPHGSQEKGEVKYNIKEEDEEYCGSQSGGKRKRKGKGKTKHTPPSKDSINGQVALNGSTQTITNENRLQHNEQKDQEGADSPNGNEKTCIELESGHCKRTYRKKGQRDASPRKVSTPSPRKVPTPSKLKGPHCRRIMTDFNTKDVDIQSEHATEQMIDLRLEEKIAAEENARLFAGRQTHPFFSSWKVGKKTLGTSEATELESKQCSILHDGQSVSYHTVHVFEMPQDDPVPLDWSNWKFSEQSSFDSSCNLENYCSSSFNGSVNPLKFDDFRTNQTTVGASFPQNETFLKHCSGGMYSKSPTFAFVDGIMSHHLPTKASEHGHENSLWTSKYQPTKASEVCGNYESVRRVNEWLGSWRERYSRNPKTLSRENTFVAEDSHYSSESDSDAESTGERADLKNVLLVSGPVGSGKSAAIYACAREQGFEVIEVSASDWRNGAQMKLKFGAAMESLGLNKWSLEVPLGLNVKHIPEFPSTQPCKSSIRESDDDVIEVLPETCKDKSDSLKSEPCNVGVKDNSTASHRDPDKTLILFEDVDAVFDEDRGLIASIQQIAETAKRPIILTSSSKDPLLPDQLDRVEVQFAIPLPEELSSLVYMVCGAEQADINPELLDQFIRCCQGDIRKTIMLLQFWCQGKTNKIDRRIQSTYGPPHFDVDAGHHILPKVIPWEFPCQLAELVEREITKSLPMVKENASLLDIVEEEEFSSQDMQEALGMNMEAKKEAMLNRNFSIQDGNGFSAQCDGLNDFSNSSGSPVAFIRRTARRGICTVFSSHSEDEIFTDNIPKDINALSLDLCNGGFPGGSHRSPAHTLAIQDYEDPSTGQLIHSERNLSIQNLFDSSPTETTQNLCETYKSVGFFDKTEINDGADISCVPESSFVPETEINLGAEFSNTVSCGHGAVDLETVSTKTAKSLDSPSFMLASSLHKVVQESNNSENILRSTCDVGVVLVHKDEEVGDSQHEHAESVSRGYQVMDECSRADFNVASTSWENSRCMGQASSVPETWRRLHSCHADLKSLLTSEQRSASQIVKLACRLTDLISVSDLMSGRCQPFMSDFLEPSMVPSAEPDMFCWPDVQVQMTTTIAQHGLCFFAKETAAQRLNSGIRSRVDLASEMIASTTNPTVLGNLLTKDSSRNHTSSSSRGSEIRLTGCDISLQREIKERLYNTIQTVVPSKMYLALKGVAFHEYISSLGQISKLEASRLTENINKTKLRCRRKRAARHYLSSGPLMLSEEDVSFLARHSCFSKIPLEVSQV